MTEKLIAPGIALLLLASLIVILVPPAKALENPYPVHGNVYMSSGEDAPNGITVYIKDTTNGNGITTTTYTSGGHTGHYQTDLSTIPNYQNGDVIVISVSYGGEWGRSSFTLDIATNLSQPCDIHLRTVLVDPYPVYGDVHTSSGEDVPNGVTVYINDTTNSNGITTTTYTSGGHTGHYQADISAIPNAQNGDVIVCSSSYGGESGSSSFTLDTVNNLSQSCDIDMVSTASEVPPTITYTHLTRAIDVSTTRTTTIVANASDTNLAASPWLAQVYKSDNVTFVANLTVSWVASGSDHYNMSATWDATNSMGVPVADGDYIIRLNVTDLANNSAQVCLTVAVYNMKERVLDMILNDQFGSPIDPSDVRRGTTYQVGASIENLESTDTYTLLIIQIKKAGNSAELPSPFGTAAPYLKSAGGKVVYITTASGNLPAGYIFNLTSSWSVPNDLELGNYTIEAFAWNHWISADPFTWEQLARKETMDINVITTRNSTVMTNCGQCFALPWSSETGSLRSPVSCGPWATEVTLVRQTQRVCREE